MASDFRSDMMGAGSGSGLNELISALKDLTGTLKKPQSPAGGTGPLGLLQGIGGSWTGTMAAMGTAMLTNTVQQSIMAGTAAQAGRFSPAAGAAAYASGYNPWGPLSKIPFVGGIIQAQTEREREPLTRQANRMSMMEDIYYGGISEQNAMRQQVVSGAISLNRQYSPAQAAYQLDLIQPKLYENQAEQWAKGKAEFTQKLEDVKKVSQLQTPQTAARAGMSDAEYKEAIRNPKYQALAKEYGYEGAGRAQKELDTYMAGEGSQYKEKLATAKTLREQAALRYQQATSGQYETAEIQNIASVATAPKVGGTPAEDPMITSLQTSTTTLIKILDLLEGFKHK